SSGRIAADRKLTLRADRRASKLEPEASRRLRTALTELEHLSDTTPEAVFVRDLLRQWLIEAGEIPANTQLLPNYPNPFNPETEISLFLEKQRETELTVYNPLGQLVKTLLSDEMPQDDHKVVWDGTNNDNIQVPSGVYIYSLEVKRDVVKGDLLVNVSLERRVKKMTLLR
ncbi:T9SS type A sorting domain-containing protein, partial [candidate division KSB1 bacterium]|nr:T9SS type A sorting domain-containing protein [candidate division KSB1 bacterium]